MQTTDQAFLLDDFDYIDFGCSKGGSLLYGREVLGGNRGVGLDISSDKVKRTQQSGFAAIEMDVTDLSMTPNCTQFVTMIDFLEHLPNITEAEKCIQAACEAATDFVFIRQPWFDSDGYLFKNGLKLYWSDWTVHPNAMTSLELFAALRKLKQSSRWRMYARSPISNSVHEAVHPLSSDPDQHAYDPAVHPEKLILNFNEPVFSQIGAIILLKDDPDLLFEIEAKTKWSTVLYDSSYGVDFATNAQKRALNGFEARYYFARVVSAMRRKLFNIARLMK